MHADEHLLVAGHGLFHRREFEHLGAAVTGIDDRLHRFLARGRRGHRLAAGVISERHGQGGDRDD